MFKLNLKIALRNLWKNKAFTLINLGGLAIGLASCMLLLLYVAYEWSYDKNISNYKKINIVYCNGSSNGEIFSTPWTPRPMKDQMKAHLSGIQYIARSTFPSKYIITNKNKNFRKTAVYAEPDFIKMINYKFLKGGTNNVLKNPNSVILTQSFASALFGNEDPINKTLLLDNKEALNVEAVIADIPANNSIRFDYLLPWSLYEKQNPWVKNYEMKDGKICLTLVQFQNESFINSANKMLQNIFSKSVKTDFPEAFLYPYQNWHLYNKFENAKAVGGRIEQLRLFLLLSSAILIIACVNFMNLSTASYAKRSKEIGIKKVIGSSRKNLIGQFIFEALITTFLATILAFILTELSLPFFNNLFQVSLVMQYQSWQFWLALVSLAITTGLLAGSYPAFYLSSFEPIKILKGFKLSGGSTLTVRRCLVIFQFVFAVCLIICTGFIYQQINYIKNKPIGFKKNNLVEIQLDGALKNPQKFNLLKDQLLKSGAVSHVSFFNFGLSSSGGGASGGVSWPGKTIKDEDITVNIRSAGLDFIKTIGAELLSGRDFSAQFADSNSVLLNEAAAKAMRLKNPVGKVIKWVDKPYLVVGVIKDIVTESPFNKTIPMVIMNNLKSVWLLELRLDSSKNISSSMDKITNVLETLNPGYPVDIEFVDSSFNEQFKNEQLLGVLSNCFGGFAIFISGLGLLGLAIFMAEQRKKEISIRKVLGATTANVLTLLNKDFVKLVVIANIIAFPVAYIIINKWLSGYEYRVEISFVPFLVAIAISMLIAVITVSVQSIKVAKANPIDALKHE